MEQSPWEANSPSANHEILPFLRNPKAHRRVHENLRLSLSWAIWVHSTPCQPIYLSFILSWQWENKFYTHTA
jgi:hypothetical protein